MIDVQKYPIIICNYCHPELTENAILSIRKFYPNVRIIVVNDLSKAPYSNIKKLENIDIVNNNRHLGHGISIDMGIKLVNTDWFYTFDHDVKFIKHGILEYFWEHRRRMVKAIGLEGVNPNLSFPFVHLMMAMWNKKVIEELNLTFARYLSDGFEFNPGYLLCRQLEEYGYKIITIPMAFLRSMIIHLGNVKYIGDFYDYKHKSKN